jgi:hypothetical protein
MEETAALREFDPAYDRLGSRAAVRATLPLNGREQMQQWMQLFDDLVS